MEQFETLIPFGRYRGYPLSVMLDDEAYLRWYRTSQLPEQYPEFHNNLMKLLQNSKQEEIKETTFLDEVKEANLLQVNFLDNLFCVEFAKSILKKDIKYNSSAEMFDISNLQFEKDNCAISFDYNEIGHNSTSLNEFHFRIYIYAYIDENYRMIISDLNKIVKQDNNIINVLYIKKYLVNSITIDTFITLLKNQNIYLKTEFKILPIIPKDKVNSYKNTNDDEVPF
jgi:hypothetical protein